MKKLFLIVLALFAMSACTQVHTGHRGVQVRFGEVDMKLGSLPEGLYTYNPFTTSIFQLDIRTQKAAGVANTYTKDIQQADIKYVINYQLIPAVVHTMYKEVGLDWDKVLVPQVVEGTLKQVVGTYDATDLIEHRGKATQIIREAIANALAPKNIQLTGFEMVNIQYQKDFEHAVEAKVIAIQSAAQAKNATVQVQENAKQTIIRAQSEAESMRIRAQALQSNPRLVEYEAVQKWDGKLPDHMFGNSVPFVNLSK